MLKSRKKKKITEEQVWESLRKFKASGGSIKMLPEELKLPNIYVPVSDEGHKLMKNNSSHHN